MRDEEPAAAAAAAAIFQHRLVPPPVPPSKTFLGLKDIQYFISIFFARFVSNYAELKSGQIARNFTTSR